MTNSRTAAREAAAWVAQWKNAGTELDRQRATELRGLSPSDAWAAIEAVLTFPIEAPLPEERRSHSGLVELQAYLRQLPSK